MDVFSLKSQVTQNKYLIWKITYKIMLFFRSYLLDNIKIKVFFFYFLNN